MDTRKNPAPGERYRHFKGNKYQIVAIARHSETGEKLVVYQALYGDFEIYARPLEMFLQPVDRIKYPNVRQHWRFELEEAGLDAKEDDKEETAVEAEENACRVVNRVEPEEQETEEVELEEPEPVKEERTSMDDLMDFLDARTCRERLNILMGMSKRLDEIVINNMAAAMEVSLEEGSLEEKYQSLIQCVTTRERFERER
ncbi:MAG: DUF1653 domain-containing protein [Clostridiales bacterium]|nr:DUF1653 domain-containing protein [Clostridiales bacterium]